VLILCIVLASFRILAVCLCAIKICLVLFTGSKISCTITVVYENLRAIYLSTVTFSSKRSGLQRFLKTKDKNFCKLHYK